MEVTTSSTNTGDEAGDELMITMTSFAPISSKIKLCGATKTKQTCNRKTMHESSMDG